MMKKGIFVTCIALLLVAVILAIAFLPYYKKIELDGATAIVYEEKEGQKVFVAFFDIDGYRLIDGERIKLYGVELDMSNRKHLEYKSLVEDGSLILDRDCVVISYEE